jgi:exonuclease III
VSYNYEILNVHAPKEGKTDDVKDSFYEELERVFDKFPKYHIKILLGDFNAKLGREDIFKPTIGNESLHEISNDKLVKNCFSQLLNVHNVSDVRYTEVLTAGSSRLEVETAIVKPKTYKSPGVIKFRQN